MGDKCGQNHLGQLTNYYILGKIERKAPRSAFVVLEFKYSKMILPTKLKTQKNEIGWIESGVNNKRYFLMPLTWILKSDIQFFFSAFFLLFSHNF